MPRNPSEIQRLLEEREILLAKIKRVFDKRDRPVFLSELRTIEGILGLVSHPYNSTEFGKLTWKANS